MMKMTIAEFAQKHGVSHSIANGVVSFLVEKGQATNTGEMRAVVDADGKPKRGRPSAVFEIPEKMTVEM